MFTQIKSTISNYSEQMDNLKSKLLEQKRNIYENPDYTSPYKDSLFSEIKEKYNNEVVKLKDFAMNRVKEVYNKIYSNIQNTITAPCPSDVIASIQLLKNSSFSNAELKSYFNKYGKYYVVKKALHEMSVQKNGVDVTISIDIGDDFISADSVLSAFENVKNETLWLIQNYEDGNVIRSAAFMSYKELDSVATMISNFEENYINEEQRDV